MEQNKVFKKIFGIGLSKTGTTSLSEALEILGISSIHYPKGYDDIEKYDSASDLFVAINFKQLDKLYPRSKFVLTTRELDGWLESVKKHRAKLKVPQKGTFAYEMRMGMYNCVDFNPKKLTKAYNHHHKSVAKYFKSRPNDLLVMDVTGGDGWEQLCGFLGLAVPNRAFPKKNVLSEDSKTNFKE